MSRYIQACDALMLSKKPWRWITVLLIILGDVMQNFTQISTAYGKVSYCEMLIYHMQNQTFAMVTAIILLAILVGDAFRHSGWDAYYIFRTGSRKCLSISWIMLIAVYCLFLSVIYILSYSVIATLFNISLLPDPYNLNPDMLFLVQSGLHPLRACIMVLALAFLRCCFLAQTVLWGNLLSRKLPLGILLLVFVGLILDYQLYDIMKIDPIYILPYDNILLFPRGVRERPGYLFSFLYFVLINCGMSIAIFFKINKIDFGVTGGV